MRVVTDIIILGSIPKDFECNQNFWWRDKLQAVYSICKLLLFGYVTVLTAPSGECGNKFYVVFQFLLPPIRFMIVLLIEVVRDWRSN